MRIVKKFGSSVLRSPDDVARVADHVCAEAAQGHQLIVVVSAFRGETDRLLRLGYQVSEKPDLRELDQLISLGDTQVAPLVALALRHRGIPACSLTGAQAGIQTDEHFGEARILKIDPLALEERLRAGGPLVIAGFQGLSASGQVTTLGRGGSDLTALALAQALHADRCEIYKDCAGIHAVDPDLLPGSRVFDVVDYQFVIDLAACGARIMNQRAVESARAWHRPFLLTSLEEPHRQTWVVQASEHPEANEACFLVIHSRREIPPGKALIVLLSRKPALPPLPARVQPMLLNKNGLSVQGSLLSQLPGEDRQPSTADHRRSTVRTAFLVPATEAQTILYDLAKDLGLLSSDP